MGRYDGMPYEMYPDNCERCAGVMGGVRGNENRHPDGDRYRVLCDYCSVEIDRGLARDIPCHDCERPLSTHVMMPIAQVEAIWEQGIALTVCSEESFDSRKLALVALDDKPSDPCNVDYMKEISS
jgi:hypothetical protein